MKWKMKNNEPWHSVHLQAEREALGVEHEVDDIRVVDLPARRPERRAVSHAAHLCAGGVPASSGARFALWMSQSGR